MFQASSATEGEKEVPKKKKKKKKKKKRGGKKKKRGQAQGPLSPYPTQNYSTSQYKLKILKRGA
jgi:hypothetical protein